MGLGAQIEGGKSGEAVEIDRSIVRATLHRMAFANDAGWYSTIVRSGYERRAFDASRQANWAFFPLWPLVWRAASFATGELMWSGLALANVLLVGAMILLRLSAGACGAATVHSRCSLASPCWRRWLPAR